MVSYDQQTEYVFLPFDPVGYLDHMEVIEGVIFCIAYGDENYLDYSADEADEQLSEQELDDLYNTRQEIASQIFPKLWRAFSTLKPLLREIQCDKKEIDHIEFKNGYVGIELLVNSTEYSMEDYIGSHSDLVKHELR